jgi:hypothetical protein
MTQRRKGVVGLILAGAFLGGLSAPKEPAAAEKKLRVVADSAQVYLQPDPSSPVVDTIDRGVILSLLYGGKVKRVWYYISFKSDKSGNIKSGYILDSEVELLFDPLLAVTIQEQEGQSVEYPPRNFDEMHWGLTKKQVVAAEGKPTSPTKARDSEVLVYGQKVINYECNIEYCFTANRLHQTRFRFAGDSEVGSASLEEYRKVKDALIRKFGKPVEENVAWRDSARKKDFSSWGTAVDAGELELNSRWLTPEPEIVARLAGEDGAASLVVLYRGLRLREMAGKSQEED